MTTAPYWLDELSVSNAVVAKPRMLDMYAVEALGTFGLVLTVGVGLASRTPFAALGIGAVLMALIYAGGHRIGAHFNPAITLAAAVWGRVPFGEAAAHWLAQLAAGVCAAIATRLVVGTGQSETVTEMMLSGRILVAASGAELLFAFVLAYVVFSCSESPRGAPNRLRHLAIGVAVVAGTVDFAALFGGVYLVSQVIAGAFTGIAFLTFGSAAR
ncbi:MAG: aquaporin [Mycobacterium sp.]|uniref:aquaporin n=1 Tax=Mycobacterium sp. TaxID=1785 RepID=UPI00389B2AF5